MDQGDVNEAFQNMTRIMRIDEMESLLNEIITLEARSRHILQCDGNKAEAEAVGNQLYTLLMSLRMAEVPSLIMNLADRFNREHDIVAMLLDAIEEADHDLDLAAGHFGNDRKAIGGTHLLNAQRLLREALERAPYERIDDEDNSDS